MPANLAYPMMFDPSQWSNKFSPIGDNNPFPWPSSYAGMPTDALGNPIQPLPGMTLNQTPAAPPPVASTNPSQWDINNRLINMAASNMRIIGPDGGGRGAYQGYDTSQLGDVIAARAANGVNPDVAQQAAPAVQSPAAPNNWQQTLSMLANPGHVTTPGATVPAASSSAQPGPGVLQAFLNTWRPAQSGPGSGFQQNFANLLRAGG